MYLEKLKLHNFRCYEDLEIEFHRRMSVIVGANGAGKSSILEAAAIALSSAFVNMDGLTARKIDRNQAHLKIYDLGSSRDVQEQYPVVVSAVGSYGQEDEPLVEWERSLSSSTGKTLYGKATEATKIGTSWQQSVRDGDKNLILPLIAYYGTGRLWDYHREKQNDIFKVNNRLNGYVDCLDGTTNIKLMMNWFEKMTIQRHQNLELGMGEIPELDAVLQAMESCYRRITGCDKVRMQYSLATKELTVAYQEDGEWMRIPISQLSDGYRCTISLVADIAYRMAVLNPQLLGDICGQTHGVVLIDEVDLHLHPAWQQRILEDLMDIFPKVQFIVTTHAMAVIHSVKSENIILLDKREAYEPSGEIYGKDVNTIIASIMGVAERPVLIKEKFQKFYANIDEENVDGAEQELAMIRELIGEDDAEIASCNVKLQLLKARKQA